MKHKFYVITWLLLAGAVLFSVVNGPVNELQMIAFGLIGLALIYGLALWSVLVNTTETQQE